jgi:DNA-binding MarR family transcriptional regulator
LSSERSSELIAQAVLEVRLHQNAYDRFEDAAAGYFGLNRTDMRCLDVLERHGVLAAGEIARQTGLTTGAVTAMLDRLERAGWVRRLRDDADRRRVLVEFTEQARRAAGEVYGPFAEAVAGFADYTDAELELIREFLRRGSELLLAQAARVQELARRPGRARAAG